MLGKFSVVYWNQLPKEVGARDQRKRLKTPELNKDFFKGTYGQKPGLRWQQDDGWVSTPETGWGIDMSSPQEHSWLVAMWHRLAKSCIFEAVNNTMGLLTYFFKEALFLAVTESILLLKIARVLSTTRNNLPNKESLG